VRRNSSDLNTWLRGSADSGFEVLSKAGLTVPFVSSLAAVDVWSFSFNAFNHQRREAVMDPQKA